MRGPGHRFAWLLHLRATALLAVLLAGVGPGVTHAGAQVLEGPERAIAKVWVNTRSGVYHCPGSRYFGTTKSGSLMPEPEARQRGYRPAGGHVCTPMLARGDSLVIQPRLLTRVWVNTNSGVYHCPGSRSYGTTRRGEFMQEGEARSRGYRPAYGRACR